MNLAGPMGMHDEMNAESGLLECPEDGASQMNLGLGAYLVSVILALPCLQGQYRNHILVG